MKKEIYFCVDGLSARYFVTNGVRVCFAYNQTQSKIERGMPKIVTTSLAHLSFDLLDLGYDIFLCKGNKKVKIEPHMDLSGIGEPCKDLRKAHNIFKMFRAGIFDELLKNE